MPGDCIDDGLMFVEGLMRSVWRDQGRSMQQQERSAHVLEHRGKKPVPTCLMYLPVKKLVPTRELLRIVEQRPVMRDHPFKNFDLGLCGVRGGQPRGGALQYFSQRIKLSDFPIAELRDDGPVVGLVRHQPLRFETLQRLANRSSADTEPKRQIGFAQSAAWRQRAILDRIQEKLIRSQSARFSLGPTLWA